MKEVGIIIVSEELYAHNCKEIKKYMSSKSRASRREITPMMLEMVKKVEVKLTAEFARDHKIASLFGSAYRVHEKKTRSHNWRHAEVF